jgi:glutamate/tyrosine decarboxylase-like PLP-dependent enzyme
VFLILPESTITLDPHKSGYVPYPAGGLCIRDERHRFLTTWTSPFINVNHENDIAMGIYGVEGRFVSDSLHFMIEIGR